MNSALRLKLKKPVMRYAAGGTPKKPGYADGGTTTYSTNIPEAAMPAYSDLIANAGQLTDPNNPNAAYQPYQGDRQATSTPLQNQSYAGVAGMQTNPYSQQAGGLAGLYAGQAGNLSYGPNSFSTYGSGPQQVSAGAGPQQTSTTSFTQPGTAGAYMNPYMQAVVDTQKREAVRSDDVARTGRQAQAVGAGAYGGSRQAIMESEANRNLQTRLGDIQTAGSDAAYKQAQAQFNTEQGLGLQSQLGNQQAALTYGGQQLQAGLGNQNAGLQFGNQYLDAQRLGEASKQFGATYGLQGLQTGIQGATAQGNLGQNLFNQQSDIYGLQNTAGTQQQQQVQSGLDQKYQEYLNQRNYPYQQLGFMSDILRGTQGTTSSVYKQEAQPSNLQNIIGLGTALAGIGKAKGGSIEGGLASIAPASVGDFADGGIVGFAEGTDKYGVPYSGEAASADAQTAADRAMFGRWWTGAKDAGERTAAAAADLATMVPRGLAGAYDTAVVRPMRAAGLPAAYLSGHLTPKGASTLSMTPYYDLIRERDPQEPDAAPAAAPAKPGETELSAIEKKPPEEDQYGLGKLFARLGSSAAVSAGPAPTMAGMRKDMDTAGYDPAAYELQATGASNKLADVQRASAQKYEQNLQELHASLGELGAGREASINRQKGEMAGRETDLKNNALLKAGLSILAAPPGGGAFAAIARGALPVLEQYGVDVDKLRKEKYDLDEKMDLLQEARRAEKGLRGKELLEARKATSAIEEAAQQRLYGISTTLGAEKYMNKPKELFNAYTKAFDSWQNRDVQARLGSSSNSMRLGLAQIAAGGVGGGGKPMTAAQRVTAVNAAADDIRKAYPTMAKDEVLRQAADFVERYQRPGATTPAARAGFSMSMTED